MCGVFWRLTNLTDRSIITNGRTEWPFTLRYFSDFLHSPKSPKHRSEMDGLGSASINNRCIRNSNGRIAVVLLPLLVSDYAYFGLGWVKVFLAIICIYSNNTVKTLKKIPTVAINKPITLAISPAVWHNETLITIWVRDKISSVAVRCHCFTPNCQNCRL